jgi:hypothetical protein
MVSRKKVSQLKTWFNGFDGNIKKILILDLQIGFGMEKYLQPYFV